MQQPSFGYIMLLAYRDLLAKRPILTQMTVAGVLVTMADILSQCIIERRKIFDFHRNFIMAFCGLIYIGPLLAWWYWFLNTLGYSAAFNVILDQFVMSPPLLCGFMLLQSVLHRQGYKVFMHRLKYEYPAVVKANWMLWIPAQLFNFLYIPYEYRMLFSQTIALFWNCYLSNKTNSRSSTRKSEIQAVNSLEKASDY